MDILLHGHHNTLLSVMGYPNRVSAIHLSKPEHEVGERLRHMVKCTPEMVSDLPEEVRTKAFEFGVATEGLWRLRRGTAECTAYWSKAVLLGYDLHQAEENHADEMARWHDKWCPAMRMPEGCLWDGKRLTGIGGEW